MTLHRITLTPDGVRYWKIAGGDRVALPFHLRWLVPFVCRHRPRRWEAARWLSATATLALLAVYARSHGLDWGRTAAVVAASAWLPFVRVWFRALVLVDGPAFALALAAAVVAPHNLPAAIALAVVAGACKEHSPITAAVLAWNPLLLIGLVAPALRLLVRQGDDLPPEAFSMPVNPGLHRNRGWLDPYQALAPWGVGLAALADPTLALAAAFAVGYGQLAIVQVMGLPLWVGRWDSARIYQSVFPVVMVAAFAVLPDALVAPAVVAHIFNPLSEERA